MQDRIKQMAEEAGLVYEKEGRLLSTTDRGWPIDEELTRFAQAIARECAEICRELANTDAHDYNDVRNECGNAIRARFGLASPPGDK